MIRFWTNICKLKIVENDYYLKLLCFFLNSTISSTGRELIAINPVQEIGYFIKNSNK
jgi:hypothetical protein